jgi:hypothetical protein
MSGRLNEPTSGYPVNRPQTLRIALPLATTSAPLAYSDLRLQHIARAAFHSILMLAGLVAMRMRSERGPPSSNLAS